MFSIEHFIWLAICIVIIGDMLFIRSKFRLSFRFVLNIMLAVSVLSEVAKILCNMIPAPDGRTGMILDPGDLPFHLCSIQIFLLFGLKFLIKKPETKENMLGFMAPSMLIGAVMALLIPTVGVEFTNVQVYQYFIFHAFLFFFSIYIVQERLVHWTWKRYVYNLAYLGGFALICMWINSALSGVLPRVNFMYLVRPPMDGLPLLNLDHGWGVYLLTLAILAVVLVGLFHACVYFIEKYRNAKTEKNEP